MNSEIISKIKCQDEFSWKDKLFITIDIDWAHDEIIKDTAKLLKEANVCATWLVTHKTFLVKELSQNKSFELGIHPNFNKLLDGNSKDKINASQIVKNMLDIVPNAKSVRSHSMTQNSRLLDLFFENNIQYDLNHFIPLYSNIELKPWKLWNGIIKIPYFMTSFFKF